MKHVRAVVFAEFDTKEGPVISSQWPDGFVSKDVWAGLYEYVIPKLDIANRVVSIAHQGEAGNSAQPEFRRAHGCDEGFRLVGAPVVISDTKYSRNAYSFNLCVALDLGCLADVTRVDPSLRALGVGLMDLEVKHGFLHNDETRKAFFARLPLLAQTLEGMLASSLPSEATFAFAEGTGAPSAVLRTSPGHTQQQQRGTDDPSAAQQRPATPSPASSPSPPTMTPSPSPSPPPPAQPTTTTQTPTLSASPSPSSSPTSTPASTAPQQQASSSPTAQAQAPAQSQPPSQQQQQQECVHTEDVDGMLLRKVPHTSGDVAGLGGAALEFYNSLGAGLCTVRTAARNAKMTHDMARVRECARSLIAARRVEHVRELQCTFMVTPLVRRVLVPRSMLSRAVPWHQQRCGDDTDYDECFDFNSDEDEDEDSDDDDDDDDDDDVCSGGASEAPPEEAEQSSRDNNERRQALLARFAEYVALKGKEPPEPAVLVRLFGAVEPTRSGRRMDTLFADHGVSAERFVRFALAHEWLVPVQDPAVVDAAYCQPNAPNPQMAQYSAFRDQHAFLRHFV